jgi:hypothetical protein
MKNILFMLVLLVNMYSPVIPLSNNEYYYSIEKWHNGNDFGGEIKVQLKILRITNVGILINIQKTMTPFSQVIDNTAMAQCIDGKFIFEFFDNWNNKIFGYFLEENDKIMFYMDCKEYSDYGGRMLSRLYGATHILSRKNNNEPITF